MDSNAFSHIDMMKGAELKRLRRLRKWTQQVLADRLMVTRETIGRWETGAWPAPAIERGLTSLFELSATHFEECAHAARSAACQNDHSQRVNNIPQAVQQLDTLLTLPSHHVTGPWTMHQIQEHLTKQIDFYFRLAMPTGEVSVAGVEEARRLIRAKIPEHVRKYKSRKNGRSSTDEPA